MLTFGVVFVAALMAVNEVPELLTLTDNVTNDFISVRVERVGPHYGVVKDPARQLLAVPSVFNLPVRLHIATASNFLLSSTAKSPRSLLLFLVTQRT
jgi:hypothetical protein